MALFIISVSFKESAPSIQDIIDHSTNNGLSLDVTDLESGLFALAPINIPEKFKGYEVQLTCEDNNIELTSYGLDEKSLMFFIANFLIDKDGDSSFTPKDDSHLTDELLTQNLEAWLRKFSLFKKVAIFALLCIGEY